MHALAKDYAPSQPAYQREEWFDNDLVRHAEKYIAGQASILEKFRGMVKHFHTLPKDGDSYGLVHTDFTDVNFFVSDHKISVFDFDDCEYHWFIYDIAVILFDSLPWLPPQEMGKIAFARYFWHHFRDSYSKENALDGYWLEQLPHFLKWREMFLYVIFHKKWDLDHLKERQSKMLQEFKHNIENDILYLDLQSLIG